MATINRKELYKKVWGHKWDAHEFMRLCQTHFHLQFLPPMEERLTADRLKFRLPTIPMKVMPSFRCARKSRQPHILPLFIRCFLPHHDLWVAKALPEGDFRYFSKSKAF